MANVTICYIGLGSNLDDPISQVNHAISQLAQLPETTLIKQSSLYRTAPMGPQDQEDFINAVVKLATRLDPFALLNHCQRLENEQGRIRTTKRWGPRIIDLDILLYGDAIINTPELTIPHYGIHDRDFVLIPLREIEQSIEVPC